MAELKCPHCGQAFTVDDTELGSIMKQIRDKEFGKDLSNRVSELERHYREKHELELVAKENEIILKSKAQYEKEKEDHQKELDNLRAQLNKALEEKTKELMTV